MRIAKPKGNTPAGASPDQRVLDLREVAAEIVAAVEKKMPRDENTPVDQFGRAGGCTAVFVLARFCERNGLAEAARELDRALLSLPLETPREYDAIMRRDRVFSLRENLERELGWMLLRDTLNACTDERVPRAELLDRFARLVMGFPGLAQIELARSHEATLRRMVEEDARPAREIETLPPDEQAREWV